MLERRNMAASQRLISKIGICTCTHILCTLFLPFVATLAAQPSFTDTSVTSFNHLAVDSRTGHVYVGAVNRIYQLSQDLEVKQTVYTNTDKQVKDNVNKALLIDYASNRLITCGSANGFCSVRNLSNITEAREVKEPVVSKTAVSTVAFIAQGTGLKHVMYVGSTYAPNSDFVNPAVSSRSLEDDRLFNIDQSGTKMYVNSLSREQYPINYVYGFSSEGFSYFLTTQLKEASSAYYSKLVRVCHSDENYYSYTEIPITCNKEGKKYNLVQAAFVQKSGSLLANELGINAQQEVLFTAFSPSETENSSKPSEASALCIYPLKEIRRRFTQNIQSCFNGLGSRGLEFITPSRRCLSTKLVINEDFCGLDVNTPLGGEAAMEAVPVATFNERITALVVAITNYYTVMFAGTAQGHLKKILVEGSNAVEYDDIVVNKESAINDLDFDTQQAHLYVMSQRKVSKVKVHECSVYRSCSTCLEVKDPYCGWCPSKNLCNAQSDCQDNSKGTIHWRQSISRYRNDTCATITHVNPAQLQRTSSTIFYVFINNLPVTDDQFYCVFKVLDNTFTTLASREIYGVNCKSPRVSSLPSFPARRHQLTAELVVKTNLYTIASTNILMTDCSSYTSCTECTSSSYPCEWCVDSNRCTHDGATYCRNEITVTGNSSSKEVPGTSFCASFHSKSANEILVPSGVKKSIAVKAHIPGYAIQSRFLCEFMIQVEKFRVNGQLLADTIYCDSFEFMYASSDSYITATFNILWGGSKTLDNPDNVHIVIYRCDLAENCGSCLTMPQMFQCGWCEGSNKCELQDNCKTPSVWLSQTRVCPNPEIHSFTPHFGPWEGGTLITIEGINLGRRILDIEGVDIAGTHCEPIPELYINSKQIVCAAVGPGDDVPREGPVIVNIAEYRGVSNDNYSFVNPIIHSIEPAKGPQSGGTLLQINGKYLDAGSDIKVFIDDSSCYILSTSHSRLNCKTSLSHIPKLGIVRINFDNASRVLDSPKFEYVEDPIVFSAETKKSSQKQPRGTPSGGTIIKVLGRNFYAIQSPKIHVYYNQKSFTAPCNKVEYDSELLCESPRIEGVIFPNQEQPLQLEYGFDMDGVGSVQIVSKELGPFVLYPDPVYERFEGVKQLKSDYLTIGGDNLDWVSTPEDIEIHIGDKFCNVTSLSRHQLTCRPPLLNELPSDVNAHDVEVKVGRKLNNIGKISYTQH